MTSWNHNTHHAARVLGLLPATGAAALEIGPGDGRFAALLSERFDEVVAVETDLAQVAATRTQCSELPNVHVLHGDFLTADLPEAHFDAVVALASFHHMPLPEAIARARRLLKPAGRLVVLGVWTDSTLRDFTWNLHSALLNRRLQRRLGPDVMSAPASFEQTSWHETHQWFRSNLPGAKLKRHALWRYTLVWDKPPS